ncbi:MAG TPA: DUF2339 domain-containing protein [Candidatus Peribacteraceae bacterium]|nr:DUF2339 domain-containing protein [Candidatus Peribacteraceae bacterium]
MEIVYLVILLLLFYLIGIPLWLIALQGKIRRLQERIDQHPSTAPPSAVPEPVKQPATPPPPPPLTPRVVAAREAVKEPKAEKQVPLKPAKSFEEQVGGHLFQWLGIGALLIALVVFLKWSFDNGIIGETGRVVLGYMLAAGGMVAGDLLRKKYGVWSLAFTGGGAFASYAVTWVALHAYHLFSPGLAFAIFILTTAVVCLLAGHYRAIALAAFGIIGGLVTPILSNSGGTTVELLSYVLILDAGILALSYFRQWRELNALAFAGTMLWEIYAIPRTDISLSTTLFFAIAFGVIYLIVPAIYNILQKKPSEPGDILMLLGNGIGQFVVILWNIEEASSQLRESYDAGIALVFAALFLVWSVLLYSKNRKDTPLVLSSLSLTVLFASLAIPLQLGTEWTSIAWSIEAAFLLWMSLSLRDVRIQYFAWPVMAAAYLWYLFNPENPGSGVVFSNAGMWIFLLWAAMLVAVAITALNLPAEERSSQTLLPFVLLGGIVLTLALGFSLRPFQPYASVSVLERFLEAAALIGGSYVVLWKARREWPALSGKEREVFTSLGVVVQIVTLAYLTFEFSDAVERKKILTGFGRPRQIMQVGISILWALYGSVTLVVGILRRLKPIRLFSIVILLIAIAKLTLIDFASLGTAARVVGFTVLGILLVAASILYQHYKDTMKSFFTDSHTPAP